MKNPLEKLIKRVYTLRRILHNNNPIDFRKHPYTLKRSRRYTYKEWCGIVNECRDLEFMLIKGALHRMSDEEKKQPMIRGTLSSEHIKTRDDMCYDTNGHPSRLVEQEARAKYYSLGTVENVFLDAFMYLESSEYPLREWARDNRKEFYSMMMKLQSGRQPEQQKNDPVTFVGVQPSPLDDNIYGEDNKEHVLEEKNDE